MKMNGVDIVAYAGLGLFRNRGMQYEKERRRKCAHIHTQIHTQVRIHEYKYIVFLPEQQQQEKIVISVRERK